MSAEARAARERDLEARSRECSASASSSPRTCAARQFEELDKLKERLDQVLTRLAHDQGYDLILQSALWVGKSMDITDDVIKALGPDASLAARIGGGCAPTSDGARRTGIAGRCSRASTGVPAAPASRRAPRPPRSTACRRVDVVLPLLERARSRDDGRQTRFAHSHASASCVGVRPVAWRAP
jgi:hypothetical protein